MTIVSRSKDRLNFGAELARLRQNAGLSQRAVAYRLEANGAERNVSGSAVGEWERGESAPTPRTTAALERIVGGSLAPFLGYSSDGDGRSIDDRLNHLEERMDQTDQRLDQVLRHLGADR